MIVGTVVGHVWATKKEERLNGLKLMVVRRIDACSGEELESLVAADSVGAGIGERVLVATGSSARVAVEGSDIPVDATIVGIIDDAESGA